MKLLILMQSIVIVALHILPAPSFSQMTDDYGFPVEVENDRCNQSSGLDYSTGMFRSRRLFRGQSYIACPTSNSYRRSSYEPISIHPCETVVVNGNNVKLMTGSNVVDMLPDGLKFKVTKVNDGWLGAVVEVNGRKKKGWVWHKNVTVDE